MPELELAKPAQRVAATTINTIILLGLALFAEWIASTSDAPSPAARAYVAAQALFGLSAIFWLICGQARTSPGLALMRLKVVDAIPPHTRVALVTALLRPLPFFLFGVIVAAPVSIIPRSVAAGHFLFVIMGALFLGANATPLWTGGTRRSLVDKWLKTVVVRR